MFRLMAAVVITGVSLLMSAEASAQPYPKGFERFGDNYQFVVFAVLEGAFNEGLTQMEVRQVLMPDPKGTGYMHFIGRCPICGATKYGFQLYDMRPEFPDLKLGSFNVTNRTFGKGTTPEIHARLMSDDVKVRLTVMHELVSKWIDARVEKMKLSPSEQVTLFEGIKAGRQMGMEMLKRFKKDPAELRMFAPGYVDLDSYAMCDAAYKLEFGAKG